MSGFFPSGILLGGLLLSGLPFGGLLLGGLLPGGLLLGGLFLGGLLLGPPTPLPAFLLLSCHTNHLAEFGRRRFSFGCRCFYFAAGASGWPQALVLTQVLFLVAGALFGPLSCCLAASVFVWPQVLFDPPTSLFPPPHFTLRHFSLLPPSSSLLAPFPILPFPVIRRSLWGWHTASG